MRKGILFRYLFKISTIYFVITLFLTCCIVLSINILDVVRALSSKNLPVTSDAIKFSFCKITYITYSLIPYVFLISTTIVLRRLNQTDQMTILKNLGYSIYDIIMPSIWLGLVIGVVNIFIWHPLSVHFADKAKVIYYKILKKPLPTSMKELWIQQKDQSSNKLIYIDKVEGKILKSVVIYYFDDPSCKQIIADSATIEENNTWILKHGVVIKTNKKMDKFIDKTINSSIKSKHLAMYYKDPASTDIFTLVTMIVLRKQANMTCDKYIFQINILLSKIFLPSLMVLLAILFCYTHHRYAYKTLSMLAVVISGFVVHFLSQVIQSVNVGYYGSYVYGWGLILVLYTILMGFIRYKEN